MRDAIAQASRAAQTAQDTAARLGSEREADRAAITPFATAEMLHPQGIGQAGIGAETGATLAGAGGANSGLVGMANQRAAASRNAGGFQAALDSAARERMKAAGGASEGIQASNEQQKLVQQQAGAGLIAGDMGTNTSGMLQSEGQIAGDVQAEAAANKPTGWIQDATSIANTATNAFKALKPNGI